MAKSANTNNTTSTTSPSKAPPTGPKSDRRSVVRAAETEVRSGGGGSDKEFEASSTRTRAERREKEESKQGDEELGRKYWMDQIWQQGQEVATLRTELKRKEEMLEQSQEFKKELQRKVRELSAKETVGQAEKGQLETRLNELKDELTKLKETPVGRRITRILYFTPLAQSMTSVERRTISGTTDVIPLEFVDKKPADLSPYEQSHIWHMIAVKYPLEYARINKGALFEDGRLCLVFHDPYILFRKIAPTHKLATETVLSEFLMIVGSPALYIDLVKEYKYEITDTLNLTPFELDESVSLLKVQKDLVKHMALGGFTKQHANLCFRWARRCIETLIEEMDNRVFVGKHEVNWHSVLHYMLSPGVDHPPVPKGWSQYYPPHSNKDVQFASGRVDDKEMDPPESEMVQPTHMQGIDKVSSSSLNATDPVQRATTMEAVVKSLPRIKKQLATASGKGEEAISVGDQDASGDEVNFDED